ncbi:hypothetical protein M422DRAFT_252090 [Sphaerobolus stellatus SS14]|uniref:Uncharacterized protein n=1 Tax=Sphaerobolus stellatus (strain SS14) TaxID=990650 RepID=A0A0C9W0R5_SPHS4|nr:hypothetical protein M422DRAFT_252090 [Sphaerobolus stellatus SS14]
MTDNPTRDNLSTDFQRALRAIVKRSHVQKRMVKDADTKLEAAYSKLVTLQSKADTQVKAAKRALEQGKDEELARKKLKKVQQDMRDHLSSLKALEATSSGNIPKPEVVIPDILSQDITFQAHRVHCVITTTSTSSSRQMPLASPQVTRPSTLHLPPIHQAQPAPYPSNMLYPPHLHTTQSSYSASQHSYQPQPYSPQPYQWPETYYHQPNVQYTRNTNKGWPYAHHPSQESQYHGFQR